MENNFLFFVQDIGEYFYVQAKTLSKAREIARIFAEENETEVSYVRCDDNYTANILGYDTF